MTMPYIPQGAEGNAVTGDPHNQAREIGMQGSPVPWIVAIIVVLIVLRFTTEKFDNSADYANLKVSAYSIMVITLSAIIGIPIAKLLFNRFPVPGLTTLVNAS